MKIAKKIILGILLFPTCLLGMEQGSTKENDIFGNSVTLEWYKITDYKMRLNLYEQLVPEYSESFADNEREFLLDDALHIKKEYAEVVNAIPPENPWKSRIAIASADRKTRVEYWKQDILQSIAKKRAELLDPPKKNYNTSSFFMVIAKDKTSTIMGFASFRLSHSAADVVAYLDVLAVVPTARRRGLAKLLVRSILKSIPEATQIGLNTRIWNTRAQAFYISLGFTEYDRHDSEISFQWIKPKPKDGIFVKQ